MPRSESTPSRSGETSPSRYPGERLGLPESGRRSVARVGRRIGALAIDWAIASVIALAIFGQTQWMPLLIFLAMQILFIATIGGSIGHRLLGMQLVPLRGGYVGLWRPIVRSVLLCLAIPALIWDSDQRGFHDVVAGTVLIRV
ncbi:RDD family protein [Compostimonas suwonensis]|uniref:RDD family protein n=1 Tax=Compostimonas suwonensis TaxID=1048394 RepID=UPI001FEBD144|nr:RDD family protein [Compostimonas suwonensis]